MLVSLLQGIVSPIEGTWVTVASLLGLSYTLCALLTGNYTGSLFSFQKYQINCLEKTPKGIWAINNLLAAVWVVLNMFWLNINIMGPISSFHLPPRVSPVADLGQLQLADPPLRQCSRKWNLSCLQLDIDVDGLVAAHHGYGRFFFFLSLSRPCHGPSGTSG